MPKLVTQQEIFDYVKNHLLTQNKQATMYLASCKYRIVKNGEVLKCAVGSLIEDDVYTPELEGRGCMHGDVMKAMRYSGVDISEENMDLISRLQSVHDVYEPSDWPYKLDNLARKFALDFEPPSVID